MMTTNKITITYGVKRSQNYQSIDISLTMEVTPAPGETVKDAFTQAMGQMNQLVDAEADAAIRDVVRASAL